MSVSVYGVGLVWPYLSELLHLVHLTPVRIARLQIPRHTHTYMNFIINNKLILYWWWSVFRFWLGMWHIKQTTWLQV